MTKEVEYYNEDTDCTLRGHIEVDEDRVYMGSPRTYTITPYIEDKKWGLPSISVPDAELISKLSQIEKAIKKELKLRSEDPKSMEEILKKKGYGGF